ncbi:hypothetical protein G7046_g2577 [Stylonectria norvegica]|nr:hypothetical protein G7046_g2577 [Stylonectria norvegica]
MAKSGSKAQPPVGLHAYLANVAHVDIWWFVGNRLDQAPKVLPKLSTPLNGSSVVPYRYYFNTVTTSYTSPFWSWEDWELQLDWMALRGINLPLAWIGIEKIFIEVFQEIGFTDEEIHSFLSGPAFLAWNHFGNIQGSWGGELPFAWVDDQFELQRKIVKRMVELGMTPILPAFPGFVPRAISRIWPNATTAKSPQWEGFGEVYTNVTYLDPFDPHFSQLQKSFIGKQKQAYGNITNFWTLDQFNENEPASGDLDYLRNVSHNTWQSLKAADPEAVWVMQGWLFSSDAKFWSNDRIEAFLGGIPVDSDILILDLVSESAPQWQRTNSFYGKPWIWCQLHDYGGNMGLYGQIENITVNPMIALQNSSSLVGFGLTPEGQEGNEIVYDLLLDQAWSEKPIDTEIYFRDWVSTRYSGHNTLPPELYSAWEIVRPTVFNNTNLTVTAVPKSILELVPSWSGLEGRVSRHGTTKTYASEVLVMAWSEMYKAGLDNPSLFSNPAYHYDLVDWTRQVLVNAFDPLYHNLVITYNSTKDCTPSSRHSAHLKIRGYGKQISELLAALDSVLATDKSFRLSTWTDAARASANDTKMADFFEYNARNQLTLWGPTGQIRDYASKQWAGLVGDFYLPRWQRFVDYLLDTEPAHYNQTDFKSQLLKFEVEWASQTSTSTSKSSHRKAEDVKSVVGKVVEHLSEVFTL